MASSSGQARAARRCAAAAGYNRGMNPRSDEGAGRRIMFDCPRTKKPVPTGVSIVPMEFKNSKILPGSTLCPHCGQVHAWSADSVYLEKRGE